MPDRYQLEILANFQNDAHYDELIGGLDKDSLSVTLEIPSMKDTGLGQPSLSDMQGLFDPHDRDDAGTSRPWAKLPQAEDGSPLFPMKEVTLTIIPKQTSELAWSPWELRVDLVCSDGLAPAFFSAPHLGSRASAIAQCPARHSGGVRELGRVLLSKGASNAYRSAGWRIFRISRSSIATASTARDADASLGQGYAPPSLDN